MLCVSQATQKRRMLWSGVFMFFIHVFLFDTLFAEHKLIYAHIKNDHIAPGFVFEAIFIFLFMALRYQLTAKSLLPMVVVVGSNMLWSFCLRKSGYFVCPTLLTRLTYHLLASKKGNSKLKHPWLRNSRRDKEQVKKRHPFFSLLSGALSPKSRARSRSLSLVGVP